MAADGIAAADSSESLVERDQDGMAVDCIHREVVILAFGREASLLSRPALMMLVLKHPAHADRDIVVKEEAHALGRLRLLPPAGQPPRRQESETGTPR